MNKNLANMLKVSEGRYLAEAEKALFQQYYQGMPERLAHAKEIEDKEQAIIGATLDTFYSKYADMQQHPENRPKAERDMSYLLRGATLAMVQQDYSEWIPQALFIFDIFDQLGFPEGSMAFAYAELRQQARAHLSTAAADALSGYLEVLNPDHLAAWEEINTRQDQLVEKLKDYVLEKHPEVKEMNNPEDNLRRDMHILVAACAEQVASGDEAPVQAVKAWLYAFFEGLQFEMPVIHETYAAAPGQWQDLLSAPTLEKLKTPLGSLSQAS